MYEEQRKEALEELLKEKREHIKNEIKKRIHKIETREAEIKMYNEEIEQLVQAGEIIDTSNHIKVDSAGYGGIIINTSN